MLSPWSRYSFRVSAINSLGKGEPSNPSPFYHTDKDIPHVAPSNVGGGGGKTGSLTITWDVSILILLYSGAVCTVVYITRLLQTLKTP